MYVTARQATRRHDMCDDTNSFDDFTTRSFEFLYHSLVLQSIRKCLEQERVKIVRYPT